MSQNNSFTQKSKERWDATVQVQVQRLGKHKQVLQTNLSFSSFDIFLKQLETNFRRTGATKVLLKAEPFLSRLKQFTGAIDSVTQTNEYATIVWGCIKGILEIVQTHFSILNTIAEMLRNLSEKLPRFEEYRALLRDPIELDEPLRELYGQYIGFCIDTILFLRSSRFEIFRKLVLRNLKHKFDTAQKDIAAQNIRFMEGVDIARARLGIKADEHILSIPITRPTRLLGVPFQQYSKFQGRQSVLESLHRNLCPRGPKLARRQTSCAVHGMGGTGKTQVALEYVWRYREEYRHIFWARAQSVPELAASFGEFAKALRPDDIVQDQNRNVELVREWMIENDSWLLVFDNADAVKLSPSMFWPLSAHGCIIITTQSRDVAQQTTSEIALDAFDDTDGSALVLKLIGAENTTDAEVVARAKTISNELGGLPLLLSHVSGFLDASKAPMSDLITSLQHPGEFKVINRFDSTTSTNFQYGKPMRLVWGLALQALSANALTTLRILTMMNPDGIREEMLIQPWDDADIDFLHESHKFEFNLIRQNLVQRHLIEVHSEAGRNIVSFHRELKRHIMHAVDEDRDKDLLPRMFRCAFTIVRRSFPRQSELQAPTNENWQACEQALPHVLSLQNNFMAWQDRVPAFHELAVLLSDSAMYMWERGLVKDGVETLAVGDGICSTIPETEDTIPTHADICAIAAAVHAEIGVSGRALAMTMATKALDLRKRRTELLAARMTVPDVDVAMLANAYNDLGVVNLQSEAWAQAEHALEESMTLKRSRFTEDSHPQQFGEGFKNLAFVALARGDCVHAKKLSSRAMELIIQVNGDFCQIAFKAQYLHAMVLCSSGELKESARVNKQLAENRKTLHGDAHALTKDSTYMVGELYRLQGKLAKAEKWFRDALQDSSQCSEESVARTKHRLAAVLNANPNHATSHEMSLEVTKLEQEAEQVRDKFEHLIEAGMQHDVLRVHDFLCSLWSGRTTGLLQALGPVSAHAQPER